MGRIVLRMRLARVICLGVLVEWGAGWCGAAQGPVLSAPAKAGTNFQFTLTGESNAAYVVQSTSELPDWSVVVTNRSREGTRALQVPAPKANRFYRAYRMPEAYFQYALAAQEGITFSGSTWVDSFDSGDPNWSTDGLYDPLKIGRSNGSLAVNYGSMSLGSALGSAHIMGFLLTAPEGSVTLGPNGSVGSSAWQASNDGIQPGYRMVGQGVYMPTVSVPFTTGFVPGAGVVGGSFYSYVFGDGNYTMSTFNGGSGIVTGHSSVHVRNVFNLSGSDRLVIAPGASLRLYVGAPSAVIGGGGIVNQTAYATNFQYYGLAANTSVKLLENSLIGTIYAPGAVFVFNSMTGSNQLSGAVVSRTVWVSGSAQIHFDERLAVSGPWH